MEMGRSLPVFRLAEPNCDVAGITKDAAQNAKELVYQVCALVVKRNDGFPPFLLPCFSNQAYGDTPEIEIVTPKCGENQRPFAYIPSHLYHIMFEVRQRLRGDMSTQCSNVFFFTPVDEKLDARCDRVPQGRQAAADSGRHCPRR